MSNANSSHNHFALVLVAAVEWVVYSDTESVLEYRSIHSACKSNGGNEMTKATWIWFSISFRLVIKMLLHIWIGIFFSLLLSFHFPLKSTIEIFSIQQQFRLPSRPWISKNDHCLMRLYLYTLLKAIYFHPATKYLVKAVNEMYFEDEFRYFRSMKAAIKNAIKSNFTKWMFFMRFFFATWTFSCLLVIYDANKHRYSYEKGEIFHGNRGNAKYGWILF